MNDSPAVLVHARGLRKYYGSGEGLVRALDMVDLDVHRGEAVAVMGPSGCGKSTLLHLIGGLDRPSAGQRKGWWGDNPVFHTPVFVLTHHPRPSIEMDGGTTFHFIGASPAEALDAARRAAGGLDIRIGGGPATIREFLAADLIDHMHIVVVPIVLGRGEPLWDGLEGLEDRFHAEAVSSPSGVTHLTFTRR